MKNYTGQKLKDLIGALARDVTSQMLKILSGQRIMELNKTNFFQVYENATKVLTLFNERSMTFYSMYRQINPRDLVKA